MRMLWVQDGIEEWIKPGKPVNELFSLDFQERPEGVKVSGMQGSLLAFEKLSKDLWKVPVWVMYRDPL